MGIDKGFCTRYFYAGIITVVVDYAGITTAIRHLYEKLASSPLSCG